VQHCLKLPAKSNWEFPQLEGLSGSRKPLLVSINSCIHYLHLHRKKDEPASGMPLVGKKKKLAVERHKAASSAGSLN